MLGVSFFLTGARPYTSTPRPCNRRGEIDVNVVHLRPQTWVELSPHVHVMIVSGKDFIICRNPDGTWPLWSCPWKLLVRVGQLAWPEEVSDLPQREV